MKRIYQLLLLLAILILSPSRLLAQYSGTSYLSIRGGISLSHTGSEIYQPQPLLSLSYGYLLSRRVAIEAPLVYQGLKHKILDGRGFSLHPTIFYALYRSDKSRFDVGGSLGLGYEIFNKPEDPNIEVRGNRQRICFYTGANLRYVVHLSSSLAVSANYLYLFQPSSPETMAQTLSLGCLFYL